MSELSFTDAPFAEPEGQLAGFIVIEATDMDAAKEIACPHAATAWIIFALALRLSARVHSLAPAWIKGLRSGIAFA